MTIVIVFLLYNYVECKKEADSFVQFQFQWHRYYSAFLLPRGHTLKSINLSETTESSLVPLRSRWLDLYDVPVEGNPVMISASSAIYAVLLKKTRDYQMNWS